MFAASFGEIEPEYTDREIELYRILCTVCIFHFYFKIQL